MNEKGCFRSEVITSERAQRGGKNKGKSRKTAHGPYSSFESMSPKARSMPMYFNENIRQT